MGVAIVGVMRVEDGSEDSIIQQRQGVERARQAGRQAGRQKSSLVCAGVEKLEGSTIIPGQDASNKWARRRRLM